LEIESILCRHSGVKDGTIFSSVREYLAPIFAGDSKMRDPPLIKVEGSVSDSLAWLVPFELLPVTARMGEPSEDADQSFDSYLGLRAEVVRCQRTGPRVLLRDAEGRFPLRLFSHKGNGADRLPGIQRQRDFFHRQSKEGTVRIALDWPVAGDAGHPDDSLAAELLNGETILHFCCHYHPLGSYGNPEPRLNFGAVGMHIFELRSAYKRMTRATRGSSVPLQSMGDRPFVFMNACYTAETLASEPLFKMLMDYQYRDIIVSETLLPDRVAGAFAEYLYMSLLRGHRFSSAVLQARRSLLEINNPAGLIYTYYGNPSLKIQEVPAAVAAERSRGFLSQFGKLFGWMTRA
jgi:hypothetical protein